MAIYSLHHSPIGKSTQAAPFTAAAHIRYITRKSALNRLEAARIPGRAEDAASFLRQAELGDRKNARVIDKLMLALPRELAAERRAELVRGFAEEVTDGRAGWLAAFHDKGKDAANPHCHLVIRDRDAATGKRVFGTSEAGSTERLRVLWERHANRALERAQRKERIDHRTLEAQGIRRVPTVHEGVRVRRLSERGRPFNSHVATLRNGAKARTRTRQVDFRKIDRDLSRMAHNCVIRLQANERDLWAALDFDRLQRELTEQARIHVAEFRDDERLYGINMPSSRDDRSRTADLYSKYPEMGGEGPELHQGIQPKPRGERRKHREVSEGTKARNPTRDGANPQRGAGSISGKPPTHDEDQARTGELARNRGSVPGQPGLAKEGAMPQDVAADYDRYDELTFDLKTLYGEREELDYNIRWPPNNAVLEASKRKLEIVERLIAEKEVELTLVEARLPPPDPAKDWLKNPHLPETPEEELARKQGRPFRPRK